MTRGLGRSYGDASLPPPGRPLVAGSRVADRLLGFDPATGLLHAEAGLSLGEMERVFWPRGFSPPVLTGTRHVTLGGMVAADVHGKNHHVAGTIGRHVERLRLLVADDSVLWCSRQQHGELFRATLGGMGLTGHILEVELRLEAIPSAWIYCESERVANLDRFLEQLETAADHWPLTVGWIDTLKQGRAMGRGILIRGRWAAAEEAPSEPPTARRGTLPVPFVLPGWLLNRVSVGLFNFAYYHKHWRRQQRGIAHPQSFFHPLDGIAEWNKIYGRRGFTQYQCLIPRAAGAAGVRRILQLLASAGGTSFLSVIKDCGERGEGLLSFPGPGITLAVDLPVTGRTQDLIDQLDRALIAEGGRIYLAKDAFTRAEHYRAMEPRLERFQVLRRQWDPHQRLASALSVRLLGDR